MNSNITEESVEKDFKLAESLGMQVANMINRAVKRANKLLMPYGYCISVQVDFCKLEKTDKNQ